MQTISIPEAVLGLGICASLAFVGWLKYRPIDDPSELPKPGIKCRHCHTDWYTKWNEKRQDYYRYAALVAVKCPENCTIEEPHLHKRCKVCEAEYPTQR